MLRERWWKGYERRPRGGGVRNAWLSSETTRLAAEHRRRGTDWSLCTLDIVRLVWRSQQCVLVGSARDVPRKMLGFLEATAELRGLTDEAKQRDSVSPVEPISVRRTGPENLQSER